MAVDVLCVGHSAYDCTLFAEEYPAENSKCEALDLLESGGGPAANAAVLLSRWGARCAFAGAVGEDTYGKRIREEFLEAGTDVSLLEMRPGQPTPFSVIIVNRQNGSRTIVNRKVPCPALRLGREALERMSPKTLLFDGHELEAAREALAAFPEAVSILDAGSWREGTAALAGEVDFLVASERFAKQATGAKDLATEEERRKCARLLRERFGTTAVVTLGERGLIAEDGGGYLHCPAFPAEAVDTTGAGDIFHGAFAYAVWKEMNFLDSLRLASMAAALSVGVPGGRNSIPTLARVKEALSHVN